MPHRFRSGQTVRLDRVADRIAPAGDYKIVKQLPEDGGELQYRIKSIRELHERVVKEGELKAV